MMAWMQDSPEPNISLEQPAQGRTPPGARQMHTTGKLGTSCVYPS